MAASVKAVLFDFYGTLGESEWTDSWIEPILAGRGYRFDREVAQRWSANSWDGREHDEHSVDAGAYAAWERLRWRSMLSDCGVVEGDLDDMVAVLEARRAEFRMRPYPESVDVLAELRRRGLRLVVCSNWDWDLDTHLEGTGVAGLVDARVSSAWVGARKPHPRIFRAALDAAGAEPAEAVFVGDNWVADVEGPRAVGMRAVHVWRHQDDPRWLPPPPADLDGVARISDLRALLELV